MSRTLKVESSILLSRDEGYNRSKSRYGSESIISGSSSIDRRSLGKSIDRKSSDSDYSGSGSRKSSSDRRLSASRHSLLSRGSDLWDAWLYLNYVKCFCDVENLIMTPSFYWPRFYSINSDEKAFYQFRDARIEIQESNRSAFRNYNTPFWRIQSVKRKIEKVHLLFQILSLNWDIFKIAC